MKTILRIIVILLIAAVVAGAFSLAVSNTSLASGPTGESGQPPALTSAGGQTMERPDGDDSLTGRLSGVITTLAKVTGITVIVLLLQKGFSLLGNRKLRLVQR
jgi:hypothetical protein